LEERILNAALRLCRTRGERGLTLRAVARAAGTTTPTVYKRFRDKATLRIAVARYIWYELIEYLVASTRLEEIYRRYIKYCEEHPEEYRLLTAAWAEVFGSEPKRPGEIWFRKQLADRFGGTPEEYGSGYYAILLLCHGASTMINMTTNERLRAELRENCIAVCDKLIQNVDILRSSTATAGSDRA
jgi:AcrR family transcriptional regulator